MDPGKDPMLQVLDEALAALRNAPLWDMRPAAEDAITAARNALVYYAARIGDLGEETAALRQALRDREGG